MIGLVFLFLFSTADARNLTPEYARATLLVGSMKIDAYIADTEDKREKGLMFINQLGANEGMIFVFEGEQPLAFWMKNTVIPLSIGYFDSKGVLVDVQEMSVPASIMDQRPPSYPSKRPARFALEMNKNWFQKNKIKIGTKLSLPEPSPSQVLNKAIRKN